VNDFNGDGAQDLAVAWSTGPTVSVLLDNGDGNFQPAQVYSCYPFCTVNDSEVNPERVHRLAE
jgi:hypothetical protein